MKFLAFFLISIGVVFSDTLPTDCDCADDYFLAWDSDFRRCLSKTNPDNLSIDNCVEYDFGANGLECTKCAPTHAFGKGRECHVHNITDCISAVIDSSTDFNDPYDFQCLECENDKIVDLSTHTCVTMTNSSIANCVKHVKDTTYKCAECDEDTFLGSAPGSYEPDCDAKPTITNCIAFNKTSDQAGFVCTACNQTTGTLQLLKPDGSACVPLVNITGCTDHSVLNNGTIICEECDSDKTLYTGKEDCALTPSNITNCTEYATADGSAWTCAACDTGFVLHSNALTCEDPSGQSSVNCDTFSQASPWLCQNCSSSYPIKQTDQQQCHEVPIKAGTPQPWWTDNCADWDHDNTNYTCVECEPHYFLTGGECQKTERSIANCNAYSNLYTCSGCEDGYTLIRNTCIACPAAQYVAPTPCSNNGGTPTNSNTTTSNTTTNGTTPGGPGTTPTNGTNTSASVLSLTLVLVLVLAQLF